MIAAVTVGVYMGWHTPELTTPVMRIQGMAIWEVLTFLLNALLFLLVGLQLPSVIDNISGHSAGELIGWGLLISAVVIGVRLIWQFTVVYLIRAIDRREAQRARRATWRTAVGGRLGRACAERSRSAAALALPLHTDSGARLPGPRPDHLPAFAVSAGDAGRPGADARAADQRGSGIEDDGAEEREEVAARVRLAEAAIARTEELDGEDWVRARHARPRARRCTTTAAGASARSGTATAREYEERSGAYIRLMYELFDAQREALLGLRNRGEISDEVRRRVERDLDLEESRLR